MGLYQLDGVAPEVDATAWIAPNAQVMGKIRLQPQASVWFGAVLRGDNELIDVGPRSNIQDGAIAHTDMGFPLVIGADCTIGHAAILHGCVLEDAVLIGMGATVLNGAHIGAGSLVGANALVTEGKKFPPRSLIVGAPAQVKRTLSEEEVEGLRRSAANYVANAARFRAGLAQINSAVSS
ncbi:MAG: gamma carbonic anhydrase family protein [Neomegalonema sp.]|nr:gamma carbonic anhydrase family protein [Neomegalonema sp.]